MTDSAQGWKQLRQALDTHSIQSPEVLAALKRVLSEQDGEWWTRNLHRWELQRWEPPEIVFFLVREDDVAKRAGLVKVDR